MGFSGAFCICLFFDTALSTVVLQLAKKPFSTIAA